MRDAATDPRVEPGDPLMLCPGCGYDLRATPAGRCPECGLAFDPATVRESGYPWAHRRKIGRVRAYARTAWRVTRDEPTLRHEAAREQDPRDGRAFRRVTAVILATAALTAWAWAVAENHGLSFLAYQQPPFWGAGRPVTPGPVADLIVPWSAGATMPWVMPACLVLIAIYLTGVQQAIFRVAAMPATYQRRVGAIAHYTAAPLVWLLPALFLFAATAFAGRALNWASLAFALLTFATVTTIAAFAGALLRVGQWVVRTRHATTAVGFLAALELLALWVLGAVLVLGLIPWCAGFFWIVIDSFR